MTDHVLPCVIHASSGDRDAESVARSRRARIDETLRESGAVLLRGFEIHGPQGLERIVRASGGEPVAYVDRATPRSRVAENVYTATDYPPTVSIFPHNENVFASSFPSRLYFACLAAAEEGGETPIADVRRVYDAIPSEIRREFLRRRVCYRRTFGRGMGLEWQDVFQTHDRSRMEAYCRSAGIEVEWDSDNRLRTRQVRPAVAVHPATGELVWLNHTATLHGSTLEPAKRRMLEKMFGVDALPNDVTYGDGGVIDDETVALVRAAYESELRVFAWQPNDVLILDNLLIAHGRRPYRGDRRLVVAMSGRVAWPDVEASQ